MGEAVEGMYCFASTVVDGKVDITLEDGTIVTKDELLTVTFQHRTKVLNAVLTVLNAVLFWLTVLTAVPTVLTLLTVFITVLSLYALTECCAHRRRCLGWGGEPY